jgi:hypothetical protein
VAVDLGVVVGDEFLHALGELVAVPIVDYIIAVSLDSDGIEIEHVGHRCEFAILVSVLQNKPSVVSIRREGLPGDLTLGDKFQLFAFAPHLWNAVLTEARTCSLLLHGEGDADSYLNPEYIVRGARDLGISAHVAMQVNVIDLLEVS